MPPPIIVMELLKADTQGSNTKSGGIMRLPLHDLVQICTDQTAAQDMDVDSIREIELDGHIIRDKDGIWPPQPGIFHGWETECHIR